MTNTREIEIILVLENIRSVYNVGSIFRSASFFGVNEIILIGTTPGPIDRFGIERKDFLKVSLGAQKDIKYKHYADITSALTLYKDYEIIAIEQSSNANVYTKCHYKNKVILIFGNEVNGISNTSLEMVDKTIEIPAFGLKESLNVSVCVGIVLSFLKDV